jgi:hypothetical protein
MRFVDLLNNGEPAKLLIGYIIRLFFWILIIISGIILLPDDFSYISFEYIDSDFVFLALSVSFLVFGLKGFFTNVASDNKDEFEGWFYFGGVLFGGLVFALLYLFAK